MIALCRQPRPLGRSHTRLSNLQKSHLAIILYSQFEFMQNHIGTQFGVVNVLPYEVIACITENLGLRPKACGLNWKRRSPRVLRSEPITRLWSTARDDTSMFRTASANSLATNAKSCLAKSMTSSRHQRRMTFIRSSACL